MILPVARGEFPINLLTIFRNRRSRKNLWTEKNFEIFLQLFEIELNFKNLFFFFRKLIYEKEIFSESSYIWEGNALNVSQSVLISPV